MIGTQRILVVDDEATARTLVTGMLRSMGFRNIVQCESGEEALERIRAGDIDLLISDMHMEGLNGIELCRAVRQLGITIPILIATADATKDSVVASVEAGCSGYIIKPIETQSFSETVMAALS